jgi:hypothetical protein
VGEVGGKWSAMRSHAAETEVGSVSITGVALV